MTIPVDVWLNATLPIKLKSDKTVDTVSLAKDVAKLKSSLIGYSTAFSLTDESPSPTDTSELPLPPATSSALMGIITTLDTILSGSPGLVKVLQKPSGLTDPGTKGNYYLDLETGVTLPPLGPTVNFIYICLASGNWIKLIVVP